MSSAIGGTKLQRGLDERDRQQHTVEPVHVDRVAELQRWQDAGAIWEVISRRGHTVTVALLRCDGGEEVDRFTADDPALLAYIGDRLSSAD